jgi:putative thioredoxin
MRAPLNPSTHTPPAHPAQPTERPWVIDADDYTFTAEVVERSLHTPVLVDCWAEWCAPCRTLGPTLERLAAEYKGRFILVKVNIDEAQQVAMALRIQSVPFMVLFVGGRPVDALVGNQPDTALRALLDKHLPPDLGDPCDEGEAALKAGDLTAAERAFDQALLDDPTRPDALLGAARVALMRGDLSRALPLLDAIPHAHPLRLTADRIKALSALAEDAGDEERLTALLAEDPKSAPHWYSLGATYALSGRLEQACDAFLKVVQVSREYRGDGGKAALLMVFDALGGEGEVVAKMRRRLASLLF